MIESLEMPNSTIPEKKDRLAAFFSAFDLRAFPIRGSEIGETANLVVTGTMGQPDQVIFAAWSNALPTDRNTVLAAAAVEFGGVQNPLVKALPERFEVALDENPLLLSLVSAFVQEASGNRCGRQVALDRLCEVIVLLVLREAIDRGTTATGLLAGLSHPTLKRALVAIHDTPQKAWRVEDLAVLSGMSRSRFMTLFPQIVGITPSAYLSAWRLTLGQRSLLRGERVKAVARQVGFASAEAFSRAYSKQFGHAPSEVQLRTA